MLGKKGITSAEAQRFTNFIKELVKGQDISIENFKVITSTALKDGQSLPMDNNVKIDNWSELLVEKAKLFGLSAWLMEAVKLKDSKFLAKSKEHFDMGTIPEDLQSYPTMPVRPDVTFAAYFETLTVKEQAEYLYQESIASHIGKFIHNFDAVREKLDTYQPTTFVAISNTETITVTHKELYDRTELLSDVEDLQGQHRIAEKAVNFVVSKHKEWVADQERAYQIAIDKYQGEYATVSAANNALIQKYRTEFENNKTTELQEIKALKIVIPTALQATVDLVKGKLDAAGNQA